MSLPKVTIAVVCYNEERNIIDCLSSLLNQSYGLKRYDILVVDNNSTDKTREIIIDLQKKHKNIKLVINKKRGIAASRNVAVFNCHPALARLAKAHARQDAGSIQKNSIYIDSGSLAGMTSTHLLAFTDADCIVPKNWLANLVKGYQKYTAKDQNIVAVGGSNIPPLTSDYYRALSIMLDSFLGSRGSVQGRQFKSDRYVPHLPCVNVLFNKEKIIEVGGFDEKLGSIIEDEDMTYRLSQKGYRFYYLKNAPVTHKMRSNIRSWAKNMFIYGKGRMWFIQKHPQTIHPYFLVPIILILTFPISLPFYLFLIFFYAVYITLISKNCHSERAGRSEESHPDLKTPKLIILVFSLLVVTHLSYGVGEIWGIVNRK